MPLDKLDGLYLADLVRRTEGIRNAIVVTVGSDSRYQVRYTASRGVVWAMAAQAGVTYKVGQEVLVQTDLSGSSSGKQPRIIGVAQSSANGAIVVERLATVVGAWATVTRLPSLPIVLFAGSGLAERHTLYGTNLTAAPTYGHANIVDAVAPVVGGVAITIEVKALVACPKARYPLTLSGQVFSDFFEVV